MGCSGGQQATVMATIVASAGGGNWNATATWVGGVAPTAADDVQFNATSGNVTILLSPSAACRSLDCTGYTGTLTQRSGAILTIGSSTAGPGGLVLKMVAAMTYTLESGTRINFTSSAATTHTITTGGKVIESTTINSSGSSYVLQDNTTINTTLDVSHGTFNTNSVIVTVGNIQCSNSGSVVSLGASTVNLTGNGSPSLINVFNSGFLTASGANLIVATASAVTRSISPGLNAGLSTSTITYTVAGSSGALSLGGTSAAIDCTVNNLFIGSGRTLTITRSATITVVTTFSVAASAGSPVTINSTVVGTAGILSQASGTITCDYLNIRDSRATGGATWIAGENSIDISGNSGWVFVTSPGDAFFHLL